MRALVMDHGKDPEVNDIGDQYMFGNIWWFACVWNIRQPAGGLFPCYHRLVTISIPKIYWRGTKTTGGWHRIAVYRCSWKKGNYPVRPWNPVSDEKKPDISHCMYSR
jgi:hypothetical protein